MLSRTGKLLGLIAPVATQIALLTALRAEIKTGLVVASPNHLLRALAIALLMVWLLLEAPLSMRMATDDKRGEDRGTLTFNASARIVALVCALASPALMDARVQAVGLVLFVAGFSFRLLAIRQLGRFYSHKVRRADGHQIIDAGPYRLVRHPAYLGVITAHLGFALVFLNRFSLLAVLLLVVPAFVWRITVEEPVLMQVPGYSEYARGRARLVPLVWAVVLGGALAPGGQAHAQQATTNLDEAKVGTYTLPPLLTSADGTAVRTAAQWKAKRRPEILGLYQDHVHGKTPQHLPKDLAWKVVEQDPQALGGTARRKQIEVRFSRKPDGPILHLLLYTPAAAKGPVPVFLVLHFNGNWAVVDDPGVRLHDTWDRKTRQRVTPAPDVKRGTSKEWDVPLILARGYGVAALHYGDIEPDFEAGAGMPLGVRALYTKPGQTERAASDWGAIGAWAWGMSRALDYLRTDRDVAGQKVIAVGQSRLGKTVLWAGAQDQRFAMVISSCSGEGGAALSRRDYGENLDNMTSRYLYQFSENFRRYHGNWNALPVDAHMLLALMAPRPLLLNTGSEDKWSDPRGEFLAAQAASPVWELFGKKGLADQQQPPLDTPLLTDVAFHEHTGRHAILATDWKVFLDFADAKLPRK